MPDLYYLQFTKFQPAVISSPHSLHLITLLNPYYYKLHFICFDFSENSDFHQQAFLFHNYNKYRPPPDFVFSKIAVLLV